MKILFCNALDQRYGSTYRARLMVRALRQLGHPTTYLESNCPVTEQVFAQSCGIKQKDSLLGYLGASLRRAQRALSDDYELVFVQKFTPLTALPISAVKLRRGRRLFVDWDDLDYQFQSTLSRQALTWLCEKNLPRLADKICTHSQFLRETASQLSGRQDIYFVPQVVDTELFDPARYDREQMRRALGLTNEIVLGYVGTATSGGLRDFDALLEAISRLRLRHPEIFLLLIGGGPLQDTMHAMLDAHGLDRYLITGLLPQDKVAAHLAAMDLALVYMRDDLGNRSRTSLKILEYLAMNKIVVGKVVGQSRVALGQHLHLIEDEIMLAEKIEELLTKAPQPTGSSREFVLDNFGLPAMQMALQQMLTND